MIRNTKIIFFSLNQFSLRSSLWYLMVICHVTREKYLRGTVENENTKGKEKWTWENEKWLEGVPKWLWNTDETSLYGFLFIIFYYLSLHYRRNWYLSELSWWLSSQWTDQDFKKVQGPLEKNWKEIERILSRSPCLLNLYL